MRRVSLVSIIALLAVLLSLIGNLAASTVEIPAPWVPWVWVAVLLLTVGVISIETYHHRVTARDQTGAPEIELENVAEDLAESVQMQWSQEETWRRRSDPAPLTVCWHLAPEHVMDHWTNICCAPEGVDPGPLDLLDHVGQIAAAYRRIPSGRLVILGAAGSGKTTLTMRFVLDLLITRQPPDPVPVIFSLGSWDPATTSLRAWLTGQLIRDHPNLARRDSRRLNLAEALLRAGRILPVLDGFDEIARSLHPQALAALHTSRLPLLLTSRSAEYTAAVAATRALRAAAVVEIDSLTLEDLAGYLPQTAGPRQRTSKWDPVLAALTTLPVTEQADRVTAVLSTPLMASLARTIYSGTLGRDPTELLHAPELRTSEALRKHLFAAFLPAVYRRPPADPRPHPRHQRWNPHRAQRWLTHLATHLNTLGTNDLAWWQLGATLTRRARIFAAALTFGLSFGLVYGTALWFAFGAETGLQTLLTYGLFGTIGGGLAFGFGHGPTPLYFQSSPRGPGNKALSRLQAGVVGLLLGTAYGVALALWDGRVYLGIVYGLLLGTVSALLYARLAGLDIPHDTTTAATPAQVLFSDRKHTVFRVFTLVVALWIVFGLAFAVVFGAVRGGLSGLALAIAMSAVAGLASNSWGRWLVFARVWLPLTRRLPWRVLAFLHDAHDRGVLRQTGALYQFRHAEVQDHLATTGSLR